MPRDDVFLQAILAHPADDAPRLIYADWLEEHGDSDRALFIRLQIALFRQRVPPSCSLGLCRPYTYPTSPPPTQDLSRTGSRNAFSSLLT